MYSSSSRWRLEEQWRLLRALYLVHQNTTFAYVRANDEAVEVYHTRTSTCASFPRHTASVGAAFEKFMVLSKHADDTILCRAWPSSAQ